tara:strand:- start:18481 stop:18675 length:195 start_codon:yes stop_codon:yes gene_type:complete
MIHLNQIPKYINSTCETIPKQVKLAGMKKRYGNEEIDILFGKYEKHTSWKKFIHNIKQILWRRK